MNVEKRKKIDQVHDQVMVIIHRNHGNNGHPKNFPCQNLSIMSTIEEIEEPDLMNSPRIRKINSFEEIMEEI